VYGRPGEAGFGQVQQGYTEMANVEMIDEMSALVLAQRAYQLNARVLQASDQILETINNLRR
jgi:flagellar basal-body rod protein FlgG